MFRKHHPKNRHVHSQETLGAHHPEGQIINKTFDKTKEKFYFYPSLRVPDASIDEKIGEYQHLQRCAYF
jgi:hypothetical protein